MEKIKEGPVTFQFRGIKLEGGIGLTGAKNDRWKLKFGYNKHFIPEIKSLAGARWDPDGRFWHVDINQHNQFQLNFLTGKPVYARYDGPLSIVPELAVPRLNRLKDQSFLPYAHQMEIALHIWTRRQCIVAAEMGTGKTLADILAMERAALEYGFDPGSSIVPSRDYWYAAPKSVLQTIKRELYQWGSSVFPLLLTYDELKKRMQQWVPGTKAPRFLTCDESSMLKSFSAQRTQAVKGLADGMRNDWGDDCFVVLLTGTPAPKSPVDWHAQTQIACPGFLKEGDEHKFRNRLAIIKEMKNTVGQKFPKVLGWKDSEKKCEVCGRLETDSIHDVMFGGLVPDGNENDYNRNEKSHTFKACVNEINLLYERMKGLVLVKFKRDCLDLPEKQYRVMEIKPDPRLVRAANTIAKTSKTTIEALTALRELSDGFQYYDKKTGERDCDACSGTGKGEDFEEIPDSCPVCHRTGAESGQVVPCLAHAPEYRKIEGRCHKCSGKGKVDVMERFARRVPCPKDDTLREVLEENEEQGRIVIFAGFTESVDRCCDIAQAAGWATIRLDGRGWMIRDADGLQQTLDPLSMFQDRKAGQIGYNFNKVAIVAHPGSGGFSHTFTEACMAVYFSNDFNGNYRSQSEDRIHRIGMDLNKGATIVDFLHLPSDRKVLDNLKAKRALELMTLGEITQALDLAPTGAERST